MVVEEMVLRNGKVLPAKKCSPDGGLKLVDHHHGCGDHRLVVETEVFKRSSVAGTLAKVASIC